MCVLLGNPVMYSRGYNISMSNPPSKNNHRRRFASRRETRGVDDARAMKIERAGNEANTGLKSSTVKSQKETIFVGFCKLYYRVCVRIYEGKDDWEKFEPCRRRVSFLFFAETELVKREETNASVIKFLYTQLLLSLSYRAILSDTAWKKVPCVHRFTYINKYDTSCVQNRN